MNNCLNCKHWNRLIQNPDVGVCELHGNPVINSYRFQFEECNRHLLGEEKTPYKLSLMIKNERIPLILQMRKEGKSGRKIAAILGVNESTVRRAIARGGMQ
jgi:transposase-like protein